MRTLLALLLCLAAPVYAQTVDAKSNTDTNFFLGSTTTRDLFVCLVPDIQNMTSQSDLTGTNHSMDCSQTTYCATAATCAASPYCSGSWWNTGEILLKNMAYSLTSQWDKIDYTAIDGDDNVVSKRANGLDHPRCDLILGLGDNMDTTQLKTYAELTAAQLHEYAMAKMFWGIIKDSGIPFIIARGNHDGEGAFSTLLGELGISGLPFYHAGHSDGDQYAIIFEGWGGQSFCAITLDDDLEGDTGDQYTASEKAWLLSNVGCGSDLPTFLVGHMIVESTGTLTVYATDVTGTAGANEVFVIAGGHYTPAGFPLSQKLAGTNVGGNAVYRFFSNWQEYNRHNTFPGNDATPSDGIGGLYTVLWLNASTDRLCAWDWNPYFQVRTTLDNGQDNGAVGTSSTCFDFDFDARFP